MNFLRWLVRLFLNWFSCFCFLSSCFLCNRTIDLRGLSYRWLAIFLYKTLALYSLPRSLACILASLSFRRGCLRLWLLFPNRILHASMRIKLWWSISFISSHCHLLKISWNLVQRCCFPIQSLNHFLFLLRRSNIRLRRYHNYSTVTSKRNLTGSSSIKHLSCLRSSTSQARTA